VATSPFEVALVETSELPAYQEIAQKALHFRSLDWLIVPSPCGSV
jgi:hypothetical protein